MALLVTQVLDIGPIESSSFPETTFWKFREIELSKD